MGRGKAASRKTKTERAGLTFPVPRSKRTLRDRLAGLSGCGLRISWCGAVYASAVAEYLAAEVLEIAGNCAKSFKLRRITPRHVLLSTHNDDELAKVLAKVTIPSAGVFPGGAPAETAAKARKARPAKAAAPAKAAPAKKAGPRVTKAMRATIRKGTAIAKKVKNADRTGDGVTTLGSRILTGGQSLTIVSADIVDVQCDAIVVPSSSSWNLGGQIGNRLSAVGGSLFRSSINEVSAAKGDLGKNEAGLVDGDNFEARYVMFCNGPSWKGNEAAKAIADLTKTIHNCLTLADQVKLTSLCIPNVGSGVASFPKHTAAQTILAAINAYFKGQRKNPTLKKVIFDLYDQESVNVYKTELARMIE